MRDRTRFGLRDGMELAGVDLAELWWRYLAIGGSGDLESVALRVLGAGPWDQREHDLIAQALNEAFIDRDQKTYPVGYCGSTVPPAHFFDRPAIQTKDTPSSTPPIPPVSISRLLEARRCAALARCRSAAAARRAAALHEAAAQLMQSNGQVQFARHAGARAQAARQRSATTAAA